MGVGCACGKCWIVAAAEREQSRPPKRPEQQLQNPEGFLSSPLLSSPLIPLPPFSCSSAKKHLRMEHAPAPAPSPAPAPAHVHLPESSNLKRRRSLSDGEASASASASSSSHIPPSAKVARTSQSANALLINYLARQNPQDLPLVTSDDSLTSILSVLTDYQAVLDRHESLACNLGARPLGPILIRRFERLFDGPPKVLKAHTGKDGTPITVSWLDVVEFARSKPDQFTLGQMSDGARVCQFYTKQCRVQISEEDFLLIGSGMPQKLIPPQPIAEDEEKELGTLEIIERNVGQICHLADQGKTKFYFTTIAC